MRLTKLELESENELMRSALCEIADLPHTPEDELHTAINIADRALDTIKKWREAQL